MSGSTETRRLEWRCRRGMKELDLLLLRYLRERLPLAANDERAAFVEFLELPDPDIARYLIAGDVPEDPAPRGTLPRVCGAN